MASDSRKLKKKENRKTGSIDRVSGRVCKTSPWGFDYLCSHEQRLLLIHRVTNDKHRIRIWECAKAGELGWSVKSVAYA